MGGCASKPKEFNERTKETAPVEQPAKVEETVAATAAETTTSADDNKESSGSKDKSIEDETPLVDLSKSEEGENKETIAAEAVPVLVLPGEAIVVENPKGETVEVEVAAKEGEIIYVEAVKETKKEEEKEKKEEEKPKTTPAATSEDKNEEPLVKV
uniref:probable serine/threonine-protein kinase kinX n=1 Tax=Fragaria vesca subsp. vesca TaxID=101020 RepID=UPI0005CB6D48|nr:PREDICTED: probable serine/threonine-protein kinase kinX [Fragaria vesca subsp. vesca]